MSSRSKSSRSNTPTNNTLSQFDRGPVQIRHHFSTLTQSQSVTLQLLFYALLEVLCSNLTNDDTNKSRLLFQLLLHFLTTSKILPASMSLSAISIGQLELAQNYVRTIRETIQNALNILQAPLATTASDRPTITSLLDREYTKVLLATQPSTNIGIDIPQPDIQLKIPIPLTMNGPVATMGFDNIVVLRYVQDFYELDKLGKGAFGSVFRARNRLDDRLYAIKKIVFSENTDRTRRQAKCALREVRVLAALSHPNIVQYHCAWLEFVPVQTHRHRTPSSASTKTKVPLPQVEQCDSLDDMICFGDASTASSANKQKRDQLKSSTKSSSTSQEDDEDGNEIFDLNTNSKNSNLQVQHEYHSDGTNSSSFGSKNSFQRSKSIENELNRQLIPFHTRNQTVHPAVQPKYIDSKIVLFIQMQLCDTTLYDWLRYRDHAIIEETSDGNQTIFYSLTDLGQQRCWSIFQQILTAVEYLHSQSFVHRDIKPRNIFLSYDLKDPSSIHVKLGDFGLATLLDSPSSPDSPEHFQHDESTGVGTALYAPPEQLNSNHCLVTTKSDSYSLGIVLFELFNIFSTEMERCRCISDLRIHMKVDKQFSDNYSFETNIIEELISIEREKRPSVEQILSLYTKEVQQRKKKQQKNTKQMIIEQLRELLRDKDERIQQLELELEKNKL